MGVYIKNMTFPKSCSVCDFKSVMGYCRRMLPELYDCTRDEGHPDWCPLREVKEPHGDLIDRDALKLETLETYGGWQAPLCGYTEGSVKNAPAVIKAEGAEE